MKLLKTFLVALAMFLALGFVACEEEGPFERGGEEVDEAFEETGEQMEEAGEEFEEGMEEE